MLAKRELDLGALMVMVFLMGAVNAALLSALYRSPAAVGMDELAEGVLGLPAVFYLTSALGLPLIVVLSTLQKEQSLKRDYQAVYLGFIMALLALFLFYPVFYLGRESITGVFRLFRRLVFFFVVCFSFIASMTDLYERTIPRKQAAIIAGLASSVYLILAFFQLLRTLCPGLYEAMLDL
ncbi:MAG: hypothetical protein QGG26_09865 [Candidatus Undinarchaeales archaeon]|jgi:hypothetical protein|nr:hypothetical protein [Candidatus Undinarchaeales archaeon]